MIKYLVILTKIIIITLITLLFSSCKYNGNWGDGIDGTGNVTVEKREIKENFTKVKVNRGLEVIVTQSDVTGVEVEADQNLLEHISTKVENGTLIITSDENIESAETLVVRVQMPVVEGLTSTSGSHIATNLTLKGKTIRLDSSSGSQIEAALAYDEVRSNSSSGSSITLSGKALNLFTDASSGSEITAEALEVNRVESDASSGSTTTVNALQELTATASSGSSIESVTKPTIINKEETSGGSVSTK
jgi:hypothetical protein